MNLALKVSFMFNQTRGNNIKENKTQKTPYQKDLQLKVKRDQCINVHTIPQAWVATGSLETGRDIKQLLAIVQQFHHAQLRACVNATSSSISFNRSKHNMRVWHGFFIKAGIFLTEKPNSISVHCLRQSLI